MPIHSDDKELFKKRRETWNDITESIGINNTESFVKTTEDIGDEYIELDETKNTNFVEGNHKNRTELIIVLDSVIDSHLQTSLVQYIY